MLTVEEAAKRIGEVVTFEGEVVSVPSSPRRAAIYVNFGEAYPMQTLSLLFADEHTNIVVKLPRLRGQTVRVTGKVRSTKTGPVITITNAAQIELLGIRAIPADLNQTGDGHPFRRQMFATIQQLFDARDFAALETVARRWQGGRERFLDGHWKIQTFFDSFDAITFKSGAEREAFYAGLDAWKAAYPHSPIPYIINASVLRSHAWHARGNGYAHTVTEGGWRLFQDRLALGRSELEAVHDRRNEFPQWYLIMQIIALGQGWPRAEYDRMFEEAIAVEPEYHFFYFHKARYLLPKWFGKPGEWVDFVNALPRRFPDGRGEMLYAYTVWNMRVEVDQELKETRGKFFRDTGLDWEVCRAGFERLRSRYPQSDWIVNNYALLAGKAGDRETTRNLLMELGSRCDMAVWVTWENVGYARMWADNKLPPRVRMGLFE